MKEQVENQIRKILTERERLNDFADAVQKLGEDLGISSEENSREELIRMVDLENEYDEEVRRRGRIFARTTDWKGRCTVIGLDLFDGDSWFEGKFPTPEEALKLTKSRMAEEEAKIKRIEGNDLFSRGIAMGTKYTAYWPDGQEIFRDRHGHIKKPSPEPQVLKSK